ncbi:Alpha/Beta hydrolase protein [Desarmillaria ectypa]|nr:Alpha/Beta hydrolase protein [Desarmillaria ectypa]
MMKDRVPTPLPPEITSSCRTHFLLLQRIVNPVLFLIGTVDNLALCAGNSDFIPIKSGGDGGDVQFWYVGYSPSPSMVIVAHQGTVVTEIKSLLTDADFVPTNLDSDLFPGLSSDIKVHGGFKETQEKSAEDILQAVTTALSDHNANSVTLVGHSLGLLWRTVALGCCISTSPTDERNFQDDRLGHASCGNLARINNKQDFIPTLPVRLLGFHHPSGEIHINDNNWNSCSGQENPSHECTDGAVETIFSSDVFDHSGPYDGITICC